jgi:lysophospholipase L1-like esterase
MGFTNRPETGGPADGHKTDYTDSEHDMKCGFNRVARWGLVGLVAFWGGQECPRSWGATAQVLIPAVRATGSGQVLPVRIELTDPVRLDGTNLIYGPIPPAWPTNGVASANLLPGDYKLILEGVPAKGFRVKTNDVGLSVPIGELLLVGVPGPNGSPVFYTRSEVDAMLVLWAAGIGTNALDGGKISAGSIPTNKLNAAALALMGSGVGGAVVTNTASAGSILQASGATSAKWVNASSATGLSEPIAMANLAFDPVYSFLTNATWGSPIATPNIALSEFEAWTQVLTNTGAFTALQVAVYPYNSSALPSNWVCNIRQMPSNRSDWTNGYAGDFTEWNYFTNWPVIASSTVFQPTTVSNFQSVVFNLGSVSGDIWVEILSDGFFGLAKNSSNPNPTPPAPCTANRAIPITNALAYVNTTSADLSFGVWLLNSAVGDFSLTPATLGKIDPPAIFNLPSTNYAVQGTEANIYFDNALRSAVPTRDLNIDVTCSQGTQWRDYFRLTPTNEAAVNYALTISAAVGTNAPASYAGTLRVVPNSQGSGVTRKLLLVGDSTTAGGQVATELVRMASTNGFKLTALGTQGTYTNLHEGRSGWRFADFYSGLNSPFTNGAGAFDFNHYLTNNSLAMAAGDWVIFNLGINDVFSYSTDATLSAGVATMLTTYSNMVHSVTNTVPGIRVGLCVTIPPSVSQDAFGNNYWTGQTYWRYRRNRYLLAEQMVAYPIGAKVPINAALDCEHNMNTATRTFNARNSATETFLSNGVHPAQSGYLQIADSIWAFLKGNE